MERDDSRWSEALQRWRAQVGVDNVWCDDERLDRCARSTAPTGRRPAAVVRPASREQVQAVVRIAAELRFPLYPISRGRNWGYGDACPIDSTQTLLDLARMDRIHHIDPVLGFAVVEPGVTQKQLFDALQERQVPFWMDATGAGPDSSVLGNTIERGFGHTPYGDHFHTSAGYEVVLADGRLLSTGFGAYDRAVAAHVYKPGLGPSLDGLFTQSNLGCVNPCAARRAWGRGTSWEASTVRPRRSALDADG
jgi:4-cresol dehydrogenase (hydroxylating)